MFSCVFTDVKVLYDLFFCILKVSLCCHSIPAFARIHFHPAQSQYPPPQAMFIMLHSSYLFSLSLFFQDVLCGFWSSCSKHWMLKRSLSHKLRNSVLIQSVLDSWQDLTRHQLHHLPCLSLLCQPALHRWPNLQSKLFSLFSNAASEKSSHLAVRINTYWFCRFMLECGHWWVSKLSNTFGGFQAET